MLGLTYLLTYLLTHRTTVIKTGLAAAAAGGRETALYRWNANDGTSLRTTGKADRVCWDHPRLASRSPTIKLNYRQLFIGPGWSGRQSVTCLLALVH